MRFRSVARDICKCKAVRKSSKERGGREREKGTTYTQEVQNLRGGGSGQQSVNIEMIGYVEYHTLSLMGISGMGERARTARTLTKRRVVRTKN